MYLRFLGIFCLVIIISFSSFAQEGAKIKPRSLGKDIKVFQSDSGDKESLTPEDIDEPSGEITLRRALSLALIKNPELRAFSWEVRAREAQALQAGLPPNPEISFELEDFGGNGSVEGFDGTETTVLLSQLIPLGGKLSKRRNVEKLNTDLAQWDYEAVRLNVLTQTTLSYLKVLAAQQKFSLELELVKLAEKVHSVVSERAREGEISPIEEKRSKVALSQTRIELERTRRELDAVRRELASMWGGKVPQFEKAAGSLDSVSPIPSFEELSDLLSQNPDIARWAAEMEQREAALKLERANAIPDPFISGGYRHISERGDNAFVVGLSIPIPVLNRNQGAISQARRRLKKSVEERNNAEVVVNAALAGTYQNLSASYAEVILLKHDLLPEAESAYKSIFEGYREGKFTLLDVLDAQRTVFNAELQYIEALLSYHSSRANVERLTGTPLEEIQSNVANNSQLMRGKTEYQSSMSDGGEIQ